MAVITLDNYNNIVSILVEKTDVIKEKDDFTVYMQNASSYQAGHMFINEQTNLCMIRGER